MNVVKKSTDEEKIAMYMRLEKKELARILIEANEYIDALKEYIDILKNESL